MAWCKHATPSTSLPSRSGLQGKGEGKGKGKDKGKDKGKGKGMGKGKGKGEGEGKGKGMGTGNCDGHGPGCSAAVCAVERGAQADEEQAGQEHVDHDLERASQRH